MVGRTVTVGFLAFICGFAGGVHANVRTVHEDILIAKLRPGQVDAISSTVYLIILMW